MKEDMAVVRREFVVWLLRLGVIIAVAGCLVFLVFLSLRKPRSGSWQHRRATTENRLEMIRGSLRGYRADYGEWPRSLSQLTNNPKGLLYLEVEEGAFRDSWHNPIIFEPYSESRGYGVLRSYGADNAPGGREVDGDIAVRFSPR
jgi:hypothetical protein